LVHFVVIWYIFHVLVCCTKKNLATLVESGRGTFNKNHSDATYTRVVVLWTGWKMQGTRVARSFVFKSKIQISVNFGGSFNGRCWYILWILGQFYGLLLYCMCIWYSSW
jgi:hypothetical protein